MMAGRQVHFPWGDQLKASIFMLAHMQQLDPFSLRAIVNVAMKYLSEIAPGWPLGAATGQIFEKVASTAEAQPGTC